jgi:arginine decarboxylase
MVPGQVITKETIEFMRKLDVKEIHGYQAALGLELIIPAKLGKNGKKNGAGPRRNGSARTSRSNGRTNHARKATR